MPFSEMTVHNRNNVLAWARSHAWGHNAKMSDDGVLFGCLDQTASRNESPMRLRTVNFVSLHELATWAGY